MATILTFCDYFAPGYKGGGPITSLRNAAHALSAYHQLKIVTRDRDLGDDAPYKGLKAKEWHQVDGIEVLYLPPEAQNPFQIAELLSKERSDVLYLNSFHSVPFAFFPLLARRLARPDLPTILAARGEFSPAALAIKGRRKTLYRKAVRALGALSGVTFQASSRAEAHDISATLGASAHITIAPDIPNPLQTSTLKRHPKLAGFARIVFLGRISRMKNVAWLIHEVGKMEAGLEVLIYGPIEDHVYWRECEATNKKQTGRSRVVYCGPVQPSEVGNILSGADALVLPSLGENYAQVVSEALSAGCPAIVSDRTPWQMLDAAGAGWCLRLEEPERWQAVFKILVAMSEAEHMLLRKSARRLAVQMAESNDAISANLALFGGFTST